MLLLGIVGYGLLTSHREAQGRAELAAQTACRDVALALRSDDRTFAEAVLWTAGAKVRAHFPDEARASVKTTENRWVLESLVRDGLELPDTTWQQWLQHRDPKLRKAALVLS